MEAELPLLTQPSLISVLSLLVAALLPYAAGLLSKQSWAPQVKGVILLSLAFSKTVVEQVIVALNSGAPFDFWAIVYSTFITFIIAVGAWFGLLKNTALANAAQKALVKDDPVYDPRQYD